MPASIKPTRPHLPPWAQWCGWTALAVLILGDWVLDMRFPMIIAIAAIPAAAWLAAVVMLTRSEKQFHIDTLKWRIANVEGWIKLRDDALDKGQPWFDDQDPEEWKFDQKYGARQSRERLEELKLELERLEGRGNAS